MNNTIIILLVSIFFASSTFADDLVLSTNVTYRNYRVTRRAPDGVTITHAGGITKVLFRDMSPETRAVFDYNSESEAKYIADQARAEKIKANYSWAASWLKDEYDSSLKIYNSYASHARNPEYSKEMQQYWALTASIQRDETTAIKERLDILWRLMQSWDEAPYGIPHRYLLLCIKEQVIILGMPRDLLKVIHGTPSSINTQEIAGHYQEQWVYESKYSKTRYYYIEQGNVTGKQE